MNATVCGIQPPHYRLPEQTCLGSVQLQVSSLDRSVEWYGRNLGFQLLERHGPDAVLSAREGVPLLRLQELPGAQPVPPRGRIGLYHFAILLPDRSHLGALLAHLSRNGIEPGASDHAVSEALYLSDPDGIGIEVYSDRPRESWVCQDRQLHMTTESLDLAGLLAAATDDWQGLPAGTTIGHIHLFVTDLDAAASFYHHALGLDQMVWGYPGALFLAAGGYHHHLGTNTWARHAQPAGPRDARLLEWTLRLPAPDDVLAAAASLQDAGYAVSGEGSDRRVADPWGNVLRLSTEP